MGLVLSIGAYYSIKLSRRALDPPPRCGNRRADMRQETREPAGKTLRPTAGAAALVAAVWGAAILAAHRNNGHLARCTKAIGKPVAWPNQVQFGRDAIHCVRIIPATPTVSLPLCQRGPPLSHTFQNLFYHSLIIIL